MKALTLTQPWATLVVRGIKRFETRSWSYNPWHQEAADPPVGSPNRYDTVSGLPMPLAIHAAKGQDRDLELELGDWSDHRILWEFADPREFDEPIPRRGSLGVWTWRAPEYIGLEAAIAGKVAP
jgi:hypothetical protein